MPNISAELITLLAFFVTTLAFFMNLNKKIDSLKDELSDFKDETRKEIHVQDSKFDKKITENTIELIKLQSRFDKYDGVHTDIEVKLVALQNQTTETKTQLTELKTQTEQRLNQVETDNKNTIKEFIQTVDNWMKRPPVL